MAEDVLGPEAETRRLLPEASLHDPQICRAGLTCAGCLLHAGCWVDICLPVLLGDGVLWQRMFLILRQKPEGFFQRSPDRILLSAGPVSAVQAAFV